MRKTMTLATKSEVDALLTAEAEMRTLTIESTMFNTISRTLICKVRIFYLDNSNTHVYVDQQLAEELTQHRAYIGMAGPRC